VGGVTVAVGGVVGVLVGPGVGVGVGGVGGGTGVPVTVVGVGIAVGGLQPASNARVSAAGPSMRAIVVILLGDIVFLLCT